MNRFCQPKATTRYPPAGFTSLSSLGYLLVKGSRPAPGTSRSSQSDRLAKHPRPVIFLFGRASHSPCFAPLGCHANLSTQRMPRALLETSPSMTTSDQSLRPAEDIADDVEVIKDLEQRGLHGLDTLSLE